LQVERRIRAPSATADICKFGFTAAESKSRIGPGYPKTIDIFSITDITPKIERKVILIAKRLNR